MITRAQAKEEMRRREGELLQGPRDWYVYFLARPRQALRTAAAWFRYVTVLPGDMWWDGRRDRYVLVEGVKRDYYLAHVASGAVLVYYCGRSKDCARRIMEVSPVVRVDRR